MKATVMESGGGRSVILAEDGLFYDIEGSYAVGSIIEYSKQESAATDAFRLRRARLVRRAAAVAACLVMALFGGLYSYRNLMVYADVTLDGGMPVKCSLNRRGEVIKVEALDESGEELAKQLNENGARGKTIEAVLSEAVVYIEKEGDAEDKSFRVVVECSDKTVQKSMTKELNKEFAAEPDKATDGGGSSGSRNSVGGSSPADQGAGGSTGSGGNAGSGGSAGSGDNAGSGGQGGAPADGSAGGNTNASGGQPQGGAPDNSTAEPPQGGGQGGPGAAPEGGEGGPAGQ